MSGGDAMDWTVLPLAILTTFLIYVFTPFIRKGWRLAAAKDANAKPGETTGQALHRLAQAIETFVDNSSHPRELLEQPDFVAALALLRKPETTFDLLRQYATGASFPLACAALEVLRERPERDSLCEPVLAQFRQMRPWTIYFALRFLVSLKERPAVGAPAAQAQPWWQGNIVIPDAFREYFEERAKLKDIVIFGDALDTKDRGDNNAIDWLLYRTDHPSAGQLRAQLKRWSELHLDRTFLSTVGRFWTQGTDDDLLITPDNWRDRLLNSATAVLKSIPHRSVLVSGETRVGKTTFLKLLSKLLAEEGWVVFESGAAELMAGQTYFGQLEERIRKVVEQLSTTKKVVWYVPDLLQIAESGRHQGQSSSILDQVSQAVSGGNLVILSETSPAGVVRLLQTRPSMRGAMEQVRLEPMTEAETASLVREVAERMSDAADIAIKPEAIDTLLHLAHQYLGSTALPGITVELLKRAANHTMSAGDSIVTPDAVLDTLSQMSGLPRSILSDNQRLDLAAVRKEFTQKVIGQDEAVGAVTDRIAMLKAGLIDPKRPIGVFLFAGPTGTGKTELAKTLASFLFGSPDRMARLDMSELQTQDSTVKVLGASGAETDSLADKVRKQPFSVVLLDEFEKAHSNVWDLFLQVFDDGRLTDATGRTVDFRHTIIILTTNLGATAHAASAIGFARKQGSYSSDQILQAVGRTFRPEFVNRIDKIIVFRPLSRDFMRLILEKELAGVLERRGLRQRDWAVEFEDSAINFLLDKGFTPDMGARPLRRAIDEHLLAPLAATLVEHRYPAGDQFLFVRSDGNAIQVEFVDPDAGEVTTPASPPPSNRDGVLARAIVSAAGTPTEASALREEMAEIDAKIASPEWETLKSDLTGRISDPDIWQAQDRASVFSRYELIDRVLEARRTAQRLHERLQTSAGKGGKISRELVARLALQLHLVRQGIDDVFANAVDDTIVSVEPAAAGGDAPADAVREWCDQLRAMYRNWATARHMRIREISMGPSRAPVFAIAGFGALRTLRDEAGLHVFEVKDGTRPTARIRVCAAPAELGNDQRTVRVIDEVLAKSEDNTAIVRRYRKDPDPLVRDARKSWRSGKLDAVLAGAFDVMGMLGD
jgi:ATP-dependent Clp protease ATP-binding subunit ClpC